MFAAANENAVAKPIGSTAVAHSFMLKLCSNFVFPEKTIANDTNQPNQDPKDETKIALWKFVFMIKCLFDITVVAEKHK